MSKCVKCGSNSVPGGNDLCWNCGWPWGGNFKDEPPTLKSDPPNSSLRDRIAAVLTAHQRQGAQHCLCGWGKLGHSHAEHQADAILAELNRHLILVERWQGN